MHSLQYKHILAKFALILLAILTATTWTFAREVSLEDKVGQLFILGFPDSNFEQTIAPQLKTIRAGGIIWFRRNLHNVEQILQLNTKVLTTTGALPPLLMLDQEGGSVSRLHMLGPFPSALALGRLSTSEEIQLYGIELGRVLAKLGFSANLAPVLDISNPNEFNFLGSRVFAGDPQLVSQAASSMARGLFEAGVLPIAKHFPGHGGIIGDSHRKLPQKNSSLEELTALDLVPFAEFARAFPISAVMTAHVAFPNIDDSGVAASFSSPILQILRTQLNYSGLIITDDLEMSGAHGAGTVGERAVAALKAGADMVMISWNQELQRQAYLAVLAAVRNGDLTLDQINERYQRIVRVKTKMKQVSSEDNLATLIATLQNHIQRIAQYHFQRGLSQSSIKKILRNHPHKLLVASADRRFNQNFADHLNSNSYELAQHQIDPHDPKVFEASDQDCVIFYVTGAGSARLLRNLSAEVRRKTLVVNSAYPAVLGDLRQYYGVINTFFNDQQTGSWLAKEFQKASISAIKVSSF